MNVLKVFSVSISSGKSGINVGNLEWEIILELESSLMWEFCLVKSIKITLDRDGGIAMRI